MEKINSSESSLSTPSYPPESPIGSDEAFPIRNLNKVTLPRKKDPNYDVNAEYEKRMLRLKDPALRWLRTIPWFGIVIGILLSGLYTFWKVKSIPSNKYCLVMEDNFDQFDLNTWEHEISLGGFGNGQFEYTTNSSKNSFVSDGKLYIVPTLTQTDFNGQELYNGFTLNLTDAGCVSSTPWKDCWITSNSTNNTILPPIQSARLTTKKSHSIKYGKVEVRAKMPVGDWMWPAIWMFPRDSKYGDWPASGEIDIIESRGNSPLYSEGGNNMFLSTLHWGLIPLFDRYKDTSSKKFRQHGNLNDKFHTYGMEWTPDYLLTWIDSPLNVNLYVAFNHPFFKRGNFDLAFPNGTEAKNPGWSSEPGKPSPFDQEFFVILDVAVGGTNGYFPDGIGKKPWIDSSPTARYDFWQARDTWLKTWSNDREKMMVVDYVKMWKMC
ncbi:hypothetical protein HK098_004155 [Nowakowskiella sp. JEL0407]|nr:hypothetical protein HK098_004155 [Nowakowskiella sp. JEL0407]